MSLENIREETELWEKLKNTEKAIVLYGMGDGADKILNVCEQKGIEVQGVFASDEFVRGQTFRGYTVKTYADIKEELSDLIILVSFASKLDSVMKKIYNLCEYDELYAPDVPVFGDGLFDKAFFTENFDNFKTVYSALSDDTSKIAYENVIRYKITGNLKYLRECETTTDECYKNIIMPKSGSGYADIGAYNGDTIREYISYAGSNVNVYAFEPDEKNFAKLEKNVSVLGVKSANLFNIAAWDKEEELTFYSRSGRNSAHTTNHSGLRETKIRADRPDKYIDSRIDYINIDAEGSDMQAIKGLSGTVDKYKPVISCAVYHRNEDMFALPLLLMQMYGKYKLYLRHFPYIPAWDTNIYIKYDE